MVGLGKRERLRRRASRGSPRRWPPSEAATLEATSIAWLLPDADEDDAIAEALVTGTILGSYRFDRFSAGDRDDAASRRRSSR